MNLAPGALASLFPFHLEVDAAGRVTAMGKSLAKVCPAVTPGSDFTANFTPFRPGDPFDIAVMRQQDRTLFVIKEKATDLPLRGQILPTRDGGFVFFGSPWLSDAGELGSRHLEVEDFAIHDPAIDMLHILRSQKMATQDLKRLAEKLRGQRTQLKEANARLTAQEAETRQLALIAERTDNAVLLADPEGRTQWVNAGFTRLTGYELDEIKGRIPGHFLQGPGTSPETVAYMRRHIRAREPFQVEVLNYHKTGRRYWVTLEVQPIFDEKGELLNFMSIVNDNTAQKTANANLRAQFKISQLLANATDFSSVIHELLAAIGVELGWDAVTLWQVGDDTRGLLATAHWCAPPVDPDCPPPGLVPDHVTQEQSLAGAALNQVATIWHENFATIASSPRLTQLRDAGFQSGAAIPFGIGDNVLGVLEVFGRLPEPREQDRDRVLMAIGSQIAQFVERTHSQAELHARSDELARLNRELSTANQAKDEFLASISHEIRTPLNGVIGAADALQDTDLDPQQHEALDTINASASHLHALLNDVLDLSRIEAGHLELTPEPVRLVDLIEETVKMFRPIASQQQLNFNVSNSLSDSLAVSVDPTRLRQILVNLLGNAFKFTAQGGVSLTLCHRFKGDRIDLEISIADTGIGIPEESASQLFQPFHQLDSSRTKKFGGTGLGLAISRRLARMMDGDIHYLPRQGSGSEFRVDLSLPLAALPTPAQSDSREINLAAPILVVDDNPSNTQVIEMMLRRANVKVHACHNAIDAMAYCAETLPPVILMDLHMPEIDGLEATQLLREEVLANREPYVPIIALTADVRPEVRRKCLDAGMDDFLAKPIRLADLRTMLQSHLRDSPAPAPDPAAPPDTAPPVAPPTPPPDEDAPPLLDPALADAIFGESTDPSEQTELAEMVAAWWQDVPPTLEAIVSLQQAGDVSAGQKRCHALRGMVANFGLARAADLLSQMEYEETKFRDPASLDHVRAALTAGRAALDERFPFLHR